jgi:hypothetical protein
MSELPPLTKQQVCDALWNKSQTKQLYTIPKAIRFHSIKPLSNTDFYDLPSVRNERAAGIGYGMRSELGFDTKNTNKPAFYPVKRDFDEGNEKGPHYSFPNSRNAYKKVYVPFNNQTEPNNPGPGQYEIKNSFGDAPLYSMGIKCGGESFDNCSPGPASYNNNLSINGNGYYPLSTTENTKPINFSLYKGKRFNYRCKFYFFIFFR